MVNPDVTHDVTFSINKSSPAFAPAPSVPPSSIIILSPASVPEPSVPPSSITMNAAAKSELEKPVVRSSPVRVTPEAVVSNFLTLL